ncbi:MAG: acetyl-CoA carboxylase biotin carboxyl carrier protein subunit [Gammaproteobacteria bacterium]|nr:acetyl-CoA carboxylase biotin carboxyl carrier protein subunit [Gammaproteobacteria bacterium]
MKLKLGSSVHEVELLARHPSLQCRVDGAVHLVSEAIGLADEVVFLTVDDRHYAVWRSAEGERIHLKIGERSFSVEVEDPLSAARAGFSDREIRADMPGVVVAIRRQVGEAVAAADPLLTIESMKMQITLLAPRAGIIAAVHYDLNQAFQKGAVLVALQPEASEAT